MRTRAKGEEGQSGNNNRNVFIFIFFAGLLAEGDWTLTINFANGFGTERCMA